MNGDILNWCIKNERIWHIQKGCGMKRVSKSASATMAIMKKFFFTMTSILKWLIVNSLFFVANFRQYFVLSKYMSSHFLHFFMLEFTKSTHFELKMNWSLFYWVISLLFAIFAEQTLIRMVKHKLLFGFLFLYRSVGFAIRPLWI